MTRLRIRIPIVMVAASLISCMLILSNDGRAQTEIRATIEHPPVHDAERMFNEIAHGILEVEMHGDMVLGPDRDGRNFWIPAGEAFSVAGKYWPATVWAIYVWKRPRVLYKPLDNENPFTVGEIKQGWSLTVRESDGRPVGYAIHLDPSSDEEESVVSPPENASDCRPDE